MKHDVTVELAGGKQIKFETGRMAKQASGRSVCNHFRRQRRARNGNLASQDPKEGIDFFPLDGGVPGVHLRRWTDPRRLHQERGPTQRKGNSHQRGRSIGPSDRSFRRRSGTKRRSWLSCTQPTRKTTRTCSESMVRAARWRSERYPLPRSRRCRAHRSSIEGISSS